MNDLGWSLTLLVGLPLLAGALIVVAFIAVTIYVVIFYVKIITRIFETKPLFLVPQVAPDESAERVEFAAADGRKLVGAYFRRTNDLARLRAGVIVFCHEFGANRWLAVPYAGWLCELGYDVFSFDFCNHGESDFIPDYQPLQWTTQHEVADVFAALDHLNSRHDADPAGVVLFGVSKGGSTAVAAASRRQDVRS
ncbi:MAG: alpha/beta hydrolase, partial [Planctomycetia bacterium]